MYFFPLRKGYTLTYHTWHVLKHTKKRKKKKEESGTYALGVPNAWTINDEINICKKMGKWVSDFWNNWNNLHIQELCNDIQNTPLNNNNNKRYM